MVGPPSTSAQASLVRARIATVDVAEDHERGPHPSGAILSPVDPDRPGGLSRFLSLESPGPANAFRLSTSPWGLRRHSLAAEMMELCGARLGLTG